MAFARAATTGAEDNAPVSKDESSTCLDSRDGVKLEGDEAYSFYPNNPNTLTP